MFRIKIWVIGSALLLVPGALKAQTTGEDVSNATTLATGSVIHRTLADRAAEVFNPKNYGAIGDGASHTVYNTYGTTALTDIAAAAGGVWSWVLNPIYGLTFSLATNTAQVAPSATIAYTPASNATASTATAASFNYAAESQVVLAGMTVTNASGTSCIAPYTTVSSVTNGLPMSITTPYASVSGQNKIRMPYVGGISVGMPVYTTAGGSTPIGVVTAINVTSTAPNALAYNNGTPTIIGSDASPALGYYALTGGSTSLNFLSVGNEASTPPANSPQVIAPGVLGTNSGNGFQLGFPAGTLITAVSGSTVTTSQPANLTNTNYQPLFAVNPAYIPVNGNIFAVSPPSITVSTNLSADIAAGSQIFFGGISNVTLSQPTASACPANANITYSYSVAPSGPGSVGGIEFDWLGTQTAINAAVAANGRVEIPSGSYTLNHGLTIANATTPFSGGPRRITINGAGRGSTSLNFPTDETRGACALGEYDRASGNGPAAEYTNFSIIGPGSYVIGAETALMSGLCVATGENVEDVAAEKFRTGFSIEGNHQKFRKLQTDYNYFGVYLEDNAATSGAQYFDESEFIADNFAGFASAWNFGLDSSSLRDIHIGFAPMGFYRVGEPYGQSAGSAGWFTNSTFMNVLPEAIGNDTYYGENGTGDIIDNVKWINSSMTLSPERGYTIPTAPINAVITAGQFKHNTFTNTDLNSNGGENHDSLSIVTCGLICGAPSSATFMNSQVSNNIWEDDTSSEQLVTQPGTPLNSTFLAPAIAAQNTPGNAWKTGWASGCFCAATSAGAVYGDVLQFSPDYYGMTASPFTVGGQVMGIAAHSTSTTWPMGGLVAVTTQGLAYANNTNISGNVAAAYVSTTTPTSITDAGSSDASAVKVGVSVAPLIGGKAPIYVRPSP